MSLMTMGASTWRRAGGGGGGGFPVVLGQTSTAQTSETDTHPVELPAVVSPGDRLVIQFACLTSSITAPSGWTFLASDISINTQGNWYYRDCDGTEGGTDVTFALGTDRRSAAIVNRIQAGTFDPAQPPVIAIATGNDNNPDSPNLSAPWGLANTLWMSQFCGRSGSPSITYPMPGGQISINNGSGLDFTEAGSCWEQSSVAGLNPSAYTRVNNRWVAATLAIKPL